MMLSWWTAFGFGLLGSFHCAGMCGPIAFALPLPRHNILMKITGILVYNLGRVLTYGLAGFIFGTVGTGLSLAGIQRFTAVAIGIMIIAGVLFPVISRWLFPATAPVYLLSGRLKTYFQQFITKKGMHALFLVGLINGLLPCGLVYLAIAGSLLTESPIYGSLYMVLFGLGTLPMMAIISFAGNNIKLIWRNRIKKLMPVVIICFGLLFVIRGLDLGIPYLSPKVSMEMQEVKPCH